MCLHTKFALARLEVAASIVCDFTVPRRKYGAFPPSISTMPLFPLSSVCTAVGLLCSGFAGISAYLHYIGMIYSILNWVVGLIAPSEVASASLKR